MAAGSIIVDLLMRTGSFETDTDRARKSLEKFKKEALATAKQLGTVIGGAASVAAGALLAFTKQAIDSADELSKLAQKTGETTEALSGLRYAFELGGVGGAEFASSMGKLARSMADGSDAFAALGVKVKNADGTLRPVGRVLDDMADKFAQYADGAEKTALVQRIFGESGANLIPVLNAGAKGLQDLSAEAARLGLVVDGETGKAAEAFNDTVTRLQKSTQAVGLAMAQALLPALQGVAEFLERGRDQAGRFTGVAESARVVFVGLAGAAGGVATAFRMIGNEAGAALAQVAAFARVVRAAPQDVPAAFREMVNIGAERRRDATREIQEYMDFLRRISATASSTNASMAAALGINSIEQFGGSGKPPAPRLPKPPGSPPGGGAAARPAMTFEQELAQSIGRVIEDSDIVRAQRLAQQIEYLDKMFFEGQLSADVYQSAMDKLTGVTDGAKDATSAFLEEQARLARLMAGTASEALNALQSDVQFLARAYHDGRISAEQYGEALRNRVGTVAQEAGTAASLAKDLGMTFSSAFEDAIVGGGKLSDVLRGLEQDIIRLVTRELVTKPLADAITGMLKGAFTGGGAGGAGGGIVAAIGSFVTSLFGGTGRAGGGSVAAGGMYRVNERGSPEMLQVNGREFLLMGRRRGWVDPTPGASRSSAAASTINAPVTINLPAGTSPQTASQIGAHVQMQLRRAALRVT
jgi:hypothetical protein